MSPPFIARQLSTLEWAQERLTQCLMFAARATGGERLGWLEDAAYWTEIVKRLREGS